MQTLEGHPLGNGSVRHRNCQFRPLDLRAADFTAALHLPADSSLVYPRKGRSAQVPRRCFEAEIRLGKGHDGPEYVYAYINTRKGPAPEKALNPPFFVEKDRVNFFIIPQNDETEEPSSEEEKKSLQDQTQTTAAK